ncbi:MAG: stage II sporulation protein D [Clostridia bacterium]|nr:stage II sporulation protein D [Clostridia bacterium]
MLLIPLIAMGGRQAAEPVAAAGQSTVGQAAASDAKTFRIIDSVTGKAENIDMADYVCGVVAHEEPATFETEALKAQAVAAFTFSISRGYENKAVSSAGAAAVAADNVTLVSTAAKGCKIFISLDDSKATWGGTLDAGWEKIRDAVASVADKIMVYDGKPIAAVFCSMSSGTTESSKDVWGTDLPYLTEVPSIGDTLVSSFESTVTLTQQNFRDTVTAKYPKASFSAPPSQWISSVSRSKAGGVITASLCEVTLRGTDIRSLFGLRSTNFQLAYKNAAFTFTVKGYGHGVGLSQHGSDYLARQGETWDEILKWYYRGVQIVDYKWA